MRCTQKHHIFTIRGFDSHSVRPFFSEVETASLSDTLGLSDNNLTLPATPIHLALWVDQGKGPCEALLRPGEEFFDVGKSKASVFQALLRGEASAFRHNRLAKTFEHLG